mgnify:CR=1 FL=1
MCCDGEHDPIAPVRRQDFTAALFPYGKLVTIPDAGHLPMLEQPEAVTAAPGKEFHRWLIHYQITPRGRLAADLGVDKSVVGRWATGAVRPSDHNLSRLTALARRAGGRLR